jgi:Cu/Ag efflux protein CusF
MRTCRPGVSMPAVTMRFEMTKHDMRKGRKTGSPVSVSRVSASR